MPWLPSLRETLSSGPGPLEARRLVSHLLALSAVTTLVLMSAFIAPNFGPPAAASTPPAGPDGTTAMPAWLLPAQVNLPLDDAQTTSALLTTAATSSLNPRLTLPLWVRTTQDTTLWSASDVSGIALGSLPARGELKPLGEFTDGRLQVYFPGDGASRAPARAWVDVHSLEPTSVPTWIAPAPDTLVPVAPRRVSDAAPPSVTARNVAVIDDRSGQLLYGEAPDARVPQASTTKIATTIVALERSSDLQQPVTVSVSATAMAAADGSSTMGLEPRERVRLETLLYGMMLPSGNDAAEQVAITVAGGSRATFLGWMNQEAEALGMINTHFANPSGMDSSSHYSSARDMAILGRYAMRNETFRTLAGTTRWTGDGYVLKNLNRLLGFYPGADGIKIGQTDNAGKTIVASAVHDGHRVYVGLMHSDDLVSDSAALFDWVWESFTWN